MRKVKVAIVLVLFALVLTPFVYSFSCSITTNTTCSDEILIYLKNDTSGYNNAHTALANYTSDYPYVLCCDADTESQTVNSSCESLNAATFLASYAETNSHVQNSTIDTYNYSSCFSINKYLLTINYRDSCIGDEVCMLTMSNYTNAHVGNCSHYTTKICANTTFTNNLPEVTLINISPSGPNTTTDLNCSFTIQDADIDTLYANYSWYKNGTLQPSLSGQTSVTNNTLKSIILTSGNTTHFENWSCQITPYDSYEYGTTNTTINLTITNTAPSVPTQLLPTDGNESLTNRYVNFSWSTSTDIDSDEITYVVNLTNAVVGGFYENTTNLSYVDNDELYTTDETSDTPYFWEIKACDPYGACSEWTTSWNFSILDVLWIETVNGEINFEDVQIGQSYDTLNASRDAFEFENYGNVKANLFNITGDDLWATIPFGTDADTENDYVQAKANYSTSQPPYNEGQTKTDWFNITDGYYTETLISEFDYSSGVNNTLVDLKITVPGSEDPGDKLTTLTFYWMKA